MMPSRHLGPLQTSAIGLGCMPMSWGYNVADADAMESRATLHLAVERGVTLFDTADVYGPYTNEETLGEYLVKDGLRDKVLLATKVGLTPIGPTEYGRNGKPEYVRSAIEDSLKRLGTDYVDVYQLHRVDPEVPIEETWGAMSQLVTEGKVRFLGLSEVSVDEIARVHAIHPVTSVQSEFSIWTSDNVDNGVLEFTRDNGIGFMPFAPLGRGFLTGTITAQSVTEGDFRSNNPRFTTQALAANQAIVDGIAVVAARHDVAPAQIALAWVLAQGDHIVPIPGTKRRKWLEQNVAAVNVVLTAQDLADIAALPKSIAPRY
ncbi:MAG: aldo/keto reductase [Actinomycetes bacterium]